jgi:hypothetical protein
VPPRQEARAASLLGGKKGLPSFVAPSAPKAAGKCSKTSGFSFTAQLAALQADRLFDISA